MLLRNPFFLLTIVTYLRLGPACFSSSSHCASSIGWAKGPTAPSYNTCSPRLLGWPLHLTETLPLWNSKDKKSVSTTTRHLRHSTRERIRWPHCKKLRPMHRLLQAHLQGPDFFGSQETFLWKDPSCQIETPASLFYKAAEESLNFNILLVKIRGNMTF